jgi:hypothetical protein
MAKRTRQRTAFEEDYASYSRAVVEAVALDIHYEGALGHVSPSAAVLALERSEMFGYWIAIQDTETDNNIVEGAAITSTAWHKISYSLCQCAGGTGVSYVIDR